jgi:hypothetical protein
MPLDVQAKSLTNRLVPVLWACHSKVFWGCLLVDDAFWPNSGTMHGCVINGGVEFGAKHKA